MLACSFLFACSVYDSQLVQQKQDSVSNGTPPSAGESGSPTKGAMPMSSAGSTVINVGSGSNLDGVPINSDDADSGTMPGMQCGDGRVSGGELCDTAITEGRTGACPTRCPPEEDCVPRVLSGTGCQAACVRTEGELGCIGGDQCCPPTCTNAQDADCSARCGNGLVEETNGETCEPGSAKPCIADVAECDDGNACTIDSLAGTPEQCNVKCARRTITELKPGDSCCPMSANALNDSDCPPRCGNGVKEAGEACDGDANCDATCKLRENANQVKCLALAKSECDRCACMHCTATELACRAGPDPMVNAACNSMLTCSVEQKCTDNTQCYCGLTGCIVTATGPCKDVIEKAAQGYGNRGVLEQATDLGTPVGMAAAADNCRVDQCRGDCR